jgi:spore coat protein H
MSRPAAGGSNRLPVGPVAIATLLAGCAVDVRTVPPEAREGLQSAEASAAVGCPVTLRGTHWLRETELMELRIDCASGLELDGTEIAFDALPEGASYHPAERLLRWQPELDQAGVYEIALRSRGVPLPHPIAVGVVDRWDHPDNIAVDPIRYTEEYGLPVFHLFTDPEINADEHTPARIVYGGRAYGAAEAKYRGKTSLAYPKKSFTLKFASGEHLSDPKRNLHTEKRVVLTSTFDDSTYLRQRLAFELWNRLGPEHVQIASFNAVVFVDNRYHGLYVATDHIDDDLIGDNGLWQDSNLFKARTHDANFRRTARSGGIKPSLHQGYTKEEGTPPDGEPDAYTDLDELVAWIDSSSDREFFAEVDQRLARREFEDWWILVGAIGADDSAGKNSYLIHDPRPIAPDPLWHCVPWDFNASFGQDWQSNRVGASADPEGLSRFNRIFERLLGDPLLREHLLQRYRSAIEGGALELGSVLALVDGWAEQNQAAALRDEQRWSDAIADYRGTAASHSDDLDYMRGWIPERWEFLQRYLDTHRASDAQPR